MNAPSPAAPRARPARAFFVCTPADRPRPNQLKREPARSTTEASRFPYGETQATSVKIGMRKQVVSSSTAWSSQEPTHGSPQRSVPSGPSMRGIPLCAELRSALDEGARAGTASHSCRERPTDIPAAAIARAGWAQPHRQSLASPDEHGHTSRNVPDCYPNRGIRSHRPLVGPLSKCGRSRYAQSVGFLLPHRLRERFLSRRVVNGRSTIRFSGAFAGVEHEPPYTGQRPARTRRGRRRSIHHRGGPASHADPQTRAMQSTESPEWRTVCLS